MAVAIAEEQEFVDHRRVGRVATGGCGLLGSRRRGEQRYEDCRKNDSHKPMAELECHRANGCCAESLENHHNIKCRMAAANLRRTSNLVVRLSS
jgi:hypothetical protein